MKKFFSNNKWMQIVVGTLMIIVGIIVVVLAASNHNKLNAYLSILVAICLFIIGGLYICISLLLHPNELFSSSLVYASICIALGVTLCISVSANEAEKLSNFLINTFAILFLSYGGICILKGIVIACTTKPIKVGAMVWNFVLGVICIISGVLILIYRSKAQQAIYMIVGLAICIFGLLNLGYGIYGNLKPVHGNNNSTAVSKNVKKGKEKKKKKNDASTDSDNENNPEIIDLTNDEDNPKQIENK